MSILINLAAEFTGKKAFDKAGKSVTSLEKSVSKLGRALGVSLSTAAVVAFGKASVKAFTEDERAAAQLANTLKNLGLSFANPQIAAYIENLSRAASISDDKLRPAFQALIQTTGSLAKSQELLNQSIEISRATGTELTQVASDLAQAYVGNTKGLKKYNLGLTQAELKAASFADIQERLNTLFAGSSAQYLNTYAGKMEALTVAAGEAQETIGKGLVDALIAVGGEDASVQSATDNFATMSDNIASAVTGLGMLIGKVKDLTGISALSGAGIDWFKVLNPVGYYLSRNAKRAQSAGMASSSANSHLAELSAGQNAAKAKAAETAAAKRAKEMTKATKANTAELKKQAALKKQGTLFDLQQIQLVAALKGQLTEEEQKRVKLQLALLMENESEAAKLSREIANAIDSTGALARFLTTLPDAKNPFANWNNYVAAAAAVPMNGAGLDFGGNTIGSPVPNFAPPAAGTYGSGVAAPVVVQIDGKTIASALMDQSLSGNQAYVNRRTGGFE